MYLSKASLIKLLTLSQLLLLVVSCSYFCCHHIFPINFYSSIKRKQLGSLEISVSKWLSRRKNLPGRLLSTSKNWSTCSVCWKTNRKPLMKCCSKKGMSVIGRSNPIRYNREKWGQGSQLCTAESSCFPTEPQTAHYFLIPVIAILKMLKYS